MRLKWSHMLETFLFACVWFLNISCFEIWTNMTSISTIPPDMNKVQFTLFFPFSVLNMRICTSNLQFVIVSSEVTGLQTDPAHKAGGTMPSPWAKLCPIHRNSGSCALFSCSEMLWWWEQWRNYSKEEADALFVAALAASTRCQWSCLFSLISSNLASSCGSPSLPSLSLL